MRILLFASLLINLLIGSIINIDLKKQTLTVVDNNTIILTSKITSGRIGHETPRGIFKVLSKERIHISNLYPLYEDGTKGGAKMPYMLRLTNSGVAIHAGEMVKYPDSHGCIRVPYGKAMKLFKIIDIGTKVIIKNRPDFNDSINIARKKELEFEKTLHYSSKKKKNRKKEVAKNVKWVEKELSYYNDL